MTKPLGILISSFDYSPVAEDEFHDWYDTEHIPERARIPGFLQCTRWLAVDLPKVSMTTYELASIDVLRSAGYLAVGYENNSPWTRRVGWRCIKRLRIEGVQATPGDCLPPERSQGLMVVAMNALGSDDALAARLDVELPELACVHGVHAARRFRAASGTHAHVLTVHLESPDVAVSTPWRRAAERLRALESELQVQNFSYTLCIRYQRIEPMPGNHPVGDTVASRPS
ncbi:MAG: hypothetical protein GEV05_04985 [Betaproteobacteria bacterium]|nr:hypothetical protein [Betaproteobacteria bacterium]